MDKDKLYGDELLIAVFAHYRPMVRIRSADIIPAFFQASRSGKYDELFHNYAFDPDGIEVSSRAISEGISNLCIGGMLEFMGSKYYVIHGCLGHAYVHRVHQKVKHCDIQVKDLAVYLLEHMEVKPGLLDGTLILRDMDKIQSPST